MSVWAVFSRCLLRTFRDHSQSVSFYVTGNGALIDRLGIARFVELLAQLLYVYNCDGKWGHILPFSLFWKSRVLAKWDAIHSSKISWCVLCCRTRPFRKLHAPQPTRMYFFVNVTAVCALVDRLSVAPFWKALVDTAIVRNGLRGAPYGLQKHRVSILCER